MRLDARARQDVAILGSGFLKLDGKYALPFVSLTFIAWFLMMYCC